VIEGYPCVSVNFPAISSNVVASQYGQVGAELTPCIAGYWHDVWQDIENMQLLLDTFLKNIK
jgi:uncharacterized protein (DUF2267 family)